MRYWSNKSLKSVRLEGCWPGWDGMPRSRKAIAVIRLKHNGVDEMPLILSLADAEKLALMLITVLLHHRKAVPDHLADFFSNVEKLLHQYVIKPTIEPQQSTPRVRPSRHTGAPDQPISDREMRSLKAKLAFASDDRALLRLLGLTDQQIGHRRAAKSTRSKKRR